MTCLLRLARAARLGIPGALLALSLPLWGPACSRGGERSPQGAARDTTSGPAYADPSVEEIVIARVGDDKIRVRDLDAKTRIQFPQFKDLRGPEAVHQKWEILLSMLDQTLWVYAGKKHGVDREPEYLESVELSRRYLLANLAVRKLVHEKATPTDEEVRRYYEENQDQFRQAARATAAILLVATRAEAEGLRRRAVAGEDFSQLVQRYTTDDATRDTGGSVGAVGTNSLIRGFDRVLPELNLAVFATPAGGFSEPLSTPRGWCFFRVLEKKDAMVIPLEDARESITKRMQSKRAQEIFATILDEVKRESRAGIDTAAYQEYGFRTLSVEEVFQMTEGESRPEQRISWFRAIARHDPKGNRAAQSLFLAGFGYAEDLRDYPRARALFQQMLETYPESDLVPSARWMLENMEKGLDNLPYADQVKRRAYGE